MFNSFCSDHAYEIELAQISQESQGAPVRAGRVASIHIHPNTPGGEMTSVSEIDVISEKGIVQDKRYFGRRSSLGSPSKRQLTLIEREQIGKHATALACPMFEPGTVRSNIETEGVDLVALAGKTIQIGGAQVLVGAPRDPCAKMDKVWPGLRVLMENGRQGVLAQVLNSGKIRVGDEIRVV